MRLLDFDDWRDEYAEDILEDYFIESEEKPTAYDINKLLVESYEGYLADYEDYAHEQYLEDKLFN